MECAAHLAEGFGLALDFAGSAAVQPRKSDADSWFHALDTPTNRNLAHVVRAGY